MIGADCLWPKRLHNNLHHSTRQYARIVCESVTAICLKPSAYGTQSMRGTKVAQTYKKSGNLRVV